MKLEHSSILDASIGHVWDLVQQPKTLEFIASPLVRFVPLQPNVWPDRWQPGRHQTGMLLFGLLPMGTHWIDISVPSPHTVRDNGHGQLVRVWDHWITLQALPDGRTKYTDLVEVQAGILTPFIWAFAFVFYRHRQRRWHQLLAIQATQPSGGS